MVSKYLNPKRKIVEKSWGYEDWIVNNEKYCGKFLFFKKNCFCSWHYHKIKDETFYLNSGKVKLLYSYETDIDTSNEVILNPGDSFHIPTTLIHRAIALEDSHIFEFSTQHFDSDSYRIIKGTDGA